MTLNFITTLLGVICLTAVLYASPVTDDNNVELNLSKLSGILEGYRPGPLIEDDALSAVMKQYQSVDVLNETDPAPSDAPPDLCQDPSVDTITRTQDGSTYVFKGDFYWKIMHNATAEVYPRRIMDDWKGLEQNLDASFTERGGDTYFFKGNHYWKFYNQDIYSGYPKMISEGFPGIPDDVDAALAWSSNGKPYFFKDDKYWRFDKHRYPHVNENYPRELLHWRGLPVNNIDAAFVWEDGYSYFFVGGNFYRYNDPGDAVAINHPPYPHLTASSWFSCEQKCNNVVMK